MAYPAGFKYTKDHEWIELSGTTGRVGITDFAQQQLGDVVYLDLPAVGTTVKAGDPFGTIESVKAVSEVYSPVSGEVIEANGALKDHPEQVNQEPYGKGWILKIRVSDAKELASLMDAAAYGEYVGQGGH